MPATAKQTAAFEELSKGGGFFNPVSVQVSPMLSSPVFLFFDNIQYVVNSNSFLNSPPATPEMSYTGSTTQADIIAYKNGLGGTLAASMPEFYNDWYVISGRDETPKEDPLFALNDIPGISLGSIAGSFLEHTDKFFGHKKGVPYGYYKSGLPPLLIKLASAKSVNDVMTALDLRNNLNEPVYPADPGMAGFPAGYFANTFPKVDNPVYQVSVPIIAGNTWYDEMVGTISGILIPYTQAIVDYYTITLPTNHAVFLSSLAAEAANITTALAAIVDYESFDDNTALIAGYVASINSDYNAVVLADPAKSTERARIDNQIHRENLRYYAHAFVMLNQGSVSTGFYQYKNDPNAFPILTSCSSPIMLDALNEIVVL